jgi:hypothetical protein
MWRSTADATNALSRASDPGQPRVVDRLNRAHHDYSRECAGLGKRILDAIGPKALDLESQSLRQRPEDSRQFEGPMLHEGDARG